MLVEHHYGDHDKVDIWYPFMAWVAELGLAGQHAAEAGPDGEHGR